MLKGLVKISLLGLALIAVVVIPGNAKLVFGYGSGNPNLNPGSGSSSSSNSSSNSNSGSTGTPTCNNQAPDKVVLYQPNHPLLPKATGPNQIRLNWLKANRATKYTVAFGLSSGKYIYGLPDVGDTNNFTVSYLTPGKTYYFVVRGVNDCMPGPWSMEWAARVGGGTGTFTKLNTNSPTVVTPPNIPVTPPTTGVVNPPTTNAQPPAQTQPSVGTHTPPQSAPAPQPGFFQNLWHGILGIFGKK